MFLPSHHVPVHFLGFCCLVERQRCGGGGRGDDTISGAGESAASSKQYAWAFQRSKEDLNVKLFHRKEISVWEPHAIQLPSRLEGLEPKDIDYMPHHPNNQSSNLYSTRPMFRFDQFHPFIIRGIVTYLFSALLGCS